MKPYKIFKSKINNQKKIKIITELISPKIPLKFFKCSFPPKRNKLVWKTTEDRTDRQQS